MPHFGTPGFQMGTRVTVASGLTLVQLNLTFIDVWLKSFIQVVFNSFVKNAFKKVKMHVCYKLQFISSVDFFLQKVKSGCQN